MALNRQEIGGSFGPVESPQSIAMRAEMSRKFDMIDQKQELRQPISSSALTHIFPRIKQFKIDWAIGEKLISPIGDAKNNPKFDQVSVAILLSVDELKRSNNRVRKLAKEIAQQEFARRERIREEQRKSASGKVAFKPVPSF